MRKPKPGRQLGFTLVEILVVVVILGIAGAIIIPQIGSRDDLKVAAASRVLMADLIYAQNLAITQQRNSFVTFSIGGKNYSVTDDTLAVVTHPINQRPYTMTFGPGGTYGLTDESLVSADFVGTTDNTAYATLGFDELGTPLVVASGGNVETLTGGAIVVQSGQHKMEIDIEPYTGTITVKSIN